MTSISLDDEMLVSLYEHLVHLPTRSPALERLLQTAGLLRLQQRGVLEWERLHARIDILRRALLAVEPLPSTPNFVAFQLNGSIFMTPVDASIESAWFNFLKLRELALNDAPAFSILARLHAAESENSFLRSRPTDPSTADLGPFLKRLEDEVNDLVLYLNERGAAPGSLLERVKSLEADLPGSG